ncbi:MAG: DnaJ domain-containing protein [Polyangiaceae bacterium]|nr:DnaJ domain-containing protein [Polyangiaceae bacterium]
MSQSRRSEYPPPSRRPTRAPESKAGPPPPPRPKALDPVVKSWLDIIDESNYYERLGIIEIADAGAIQDAFQRFSLAFHPDRHRHASPPMRAAVTKIFKRGAEAYGVLKAEEKRNRYDIGLARSELRLDQAGSCPPEQSGRTSHGVPAVLQLCHSPAAKLHARQAERALQEGDTSSATQLLKKALLADGQNPELEQAILRLEKSPPREKAN